MSRVIEAIDTFQENNKQHTEFMDVAHKARFVQHSRHTHAARFEAVMFQGYGPYGLSHAETALMTAYKTTDIIKYKNLGNKAVGAEVARVARARFRKAHDIGEMHGSGGAVGATVVAYGSMLHIAHIGDVQAHYVGEDGTMQRLTTPHDTSNAREVRRIRKAGGWLKAIDDKELFFGQWPFSRSIGDHDTPELLPDCEVSSITLETPGVLVMATRGVWQAFNTDKVGEFLHEARLTEQLKPATQILAQEAAARSQANVGLLVAPFAYAS